MRAEGWDRTCRSRLRSQSGATLRAPRSARPETRRARRARPAVDSSPVADAEDGRAHSPENGHEGQDERPVQMRHADALEKPVREREQGSSAEREAERLHLDAFL